MLMIFFTGSDTDSDDESIPDMEPVVTTATSNMEPQVTAAADQQLPSLEVTKGCSNNNSLLCTI